MTKYQRNLLLIAASVSSATGLAAELLLGTLATYLVGNQVLAYGVAVGVFLAAMGIGSYFTQFINPNGDSSGKQHSLLIRFVQVELLIAPLTAILPLGLFYLFVIDGLLWLGLFLVTLILGFLAGLEVPLLTRILEQEQGLKDSLAGVLALDYFGALLGSLAFPIILLPWLGLFPTACIIGSFPALMVFLIGKSFPRLRLWRSLSIIMVISLWLFAPLTILVGDRLENSLYNAPVIAKIQSPIQKIVLTRFNQDVRLFLDGDLQFSTLDEYRYHEALVHPAMSAVKNHRQILLLGAGDGMALREILKYPDVEKIVIIELDREIINLARNYPLLVNVNENAFEDQRVEIVYGDAFKITPELATQFDVIIADFPDPDQEILAKLYSQGFYQRLLSKLSPNGVFVTQASSPFFVPKVLACINKTLASIDYHVYPYIADVPSFGIWGFSLASKNAINFNKLTLSIPTRFLTNQLLQQLFVIPQDIKLDPNLVKINRLVHPTIVNYQKDWRGNIY